MPGLGLRVRGLVADGFLTVTLGRVVRKLIRAGAFDSYDVEIRRGDQVLDVQQLRVVRPMAGGRAKGFGAGASLSVGFFQGEGKVVVQGAAGLDIHPRDRFNIDGVLYQVIYVHPVRQHEVLATVEVLQ